MTAQFYEEQFAESELARFGNQGRILFGLVHLEEHAANMAAAWLQGGWKDDELAEMLTTGLLETIGECAEYIEISRVAEETDAFAVTWDIFLETVKRLGSASNPKTKAIKPILLLLPLAASALRSSAKLALGLSSQGSSLVDPGFLYTIKSKAEELGCVLSTESGASETLDLIAAALRDHSATL
jgi:hypothetical protein